MPRKTKDRNCCADNAEACKVDSIVSVDERGQMVLPKELRQKAGIKAGDKLAVATWERNGEVCCITLVKVEDLVGMLKDKLAPVMKELSSRSSGERRT